MLEGRNETSPTNSDTIIRPDDCVNSENNNNHSIDNSVADCKNGLSSTKISNPSTSCPTTIIVDEKKEVDSANNMLNLNNIGEYSVEMLARLTSSTMTILANHHSGNNMKNGTTKKQKSQKFKPSSVWKHFVRLSDGNVRCVHCAKVLKRKDSSTKTMWGHLRAIHFKGQDWTVLQQRALRDRNRPQTNRIDVPSLDELNSSGIITTQNWLEQRVGILCDKPQEAQTPTSEMTGQLDELSTDWSNRSSSLVSNSCTTNSKNIDQNTINDCTYNGNGLNTTCAQSSDRNTDEKSLNFLSSIPHTSEVINITAGYNGSTDNHCSALSGRLKEENSNGGYSSADISSAALNVSNSLISPAQNHVNVTDQSISSINSALLHIFDSFSIFDPDSMVIFMRAATDLDCTLSFHCRNNQPQLSFESNRTAANKLKGVEVCLTEMDDEVNIVVQNDGIELDRESWKKTDKAQFMWAIRGKCQKVLTQ
ncbi:unnamed protein product [Cercopithifilaria johnstoni]|uniref:BED-type domain-containing protein n=1 Tax=Cercopithifilaria johnstoni TaxID=2874296 RepID=A0A8J2Q0D9_9BILA|nr:unnamed protein product [Cercopithifilaria johnstoni]